MFQVLRLIEDVRTGPNWESYWTTPIPDNNPASVGSWVIADNHPASSEVRTDNAGLDLRRAKSALVSLRSLAPDAGFVQKFPLPFSASDFRDLIIPHVQQIADYSEFRIGIARVRQAASQGASKEKLVDMMHAIWKPVSEYNTWVGMPSTIELNAQVRAIRMIEKDFGIVVKDPDALVRRDADRIMETLWRRQAYSTTPVLWKSFSESGNSSRDCDSSCDGLIDHHFQYLTQVNRDAWRDREALLLKRGNISKVQTPDGTRYQLTKWREWAPKHQ